MCVDLVLAELLQCLLSCEPVLVVYPFVFEVIVDVLCFVGHVAVVFCCVCFYVPNSCHCSFLFSMQEDQQTMVYAGFDLLRELPDKTALGK